MSAPDDQDSHLQHLAPVPPDDNGGENNTTEIPKPIDIWLGLFGIAVGLVLFLLPKTPPVVVVCLVLMFTLLIHPFWNFWWIEYKRYRQVVATILLVGLVMLVGYCAWPSPPTALPPLGSSSSSVSTSAPTSPSSSPQIQKPPTSSGFQAGPLIDEIFLLGLPLVPFGQILMDIEHGKPTPPIKWGWGHWQGQPEEPVYVFKQNGRIYLNAQLWADGHQEALIDRNRVTLVAPRWDSNYSEAALEIIDEDRHPVFQMIYRGASSLIINGVFLYPSGALLGSDTFGFSEIFPKHGKLTIPWNYTKRIFKYPSWQYPHHYVDSGAP